MKINKIAVSNILSFEYKDKFAEEDWLVFNENLNILIGPNASGKSNFLEIINFLFKAGLLMECFRFDDRILEFERTGNEEKLKEVLQFKKQRKSTLNKNDKSDKDLQRIEVEIGLNDQDHKNITFLKDHLTRIRELLRKYSNIPSSIDDPPDPFQLPVTITLELRNDLYGYGILGVPDIKDPVPRFIFQYFRWFNFIQNIIEIARTREGENWSFLKNTFTLLGSNRAFSIIDETVRPAMDEGAVTDLMNAIFENSIKSNSSGEPIALRYVKNKLIKEFEKVEIAFSKGKQSNQGQKTIDLIESEIFKKINKLLGKYLKLELFFEKQSSVDYLFYFIDNESGKKVDINALSSGQKELLLFIFCLYGFDLKNGLMIIDEPELHLHTQWQQKYLEIIDEAITDLDIQFIAATHSPIFVNPQTIEGVLRFYKKNNFTKVIRNQITASERDLIQILNYTNSSKIFFVDKVVLIEGDSDEYFFRFYFDYFKNNNTVKEENIEFLYIGGKDRYPVWRDFLKKYEIASYFIGDLDNVFDIELEIIDQATLDILQNDFEVQPTITQKMTTNSNYKRGTKQYRKDLLNFVKANKQNEWQTITSNIDRRYSDRIYILKEGELENYTQSHSKLKGIIRFCKNDFSNWVGDAQQSSKISELDTIFTEIVE